MSIKNINRGLETCDPFSFIGKNKLKTSVLFVFFWVLFYFLSDRFNLRERIAPVTVLAILSTVFYIFTLLFVYYLYVRLKNKLTKTEEISLGDKIIFGLKIVIILAMAPNFFKILFDMTDNDISLLAIIVLLLIPAWIVFSILVKKILDSFYVLAIIFIVSIIITSTIFFKTPFFENILQVQTFLNGFMGFISSVFFPSLLISLIFFEIPKMLRKKFSSAAGGL